VFTDHNIKTDPKEVLCNVVIVPTGFLWRRITPHGGLLRRPQWSRELRHEPSSPARILVSWARIPLEARMSVCVYSVFVLFSV
jgi:hypothetical protein